MQPACRAAAGIVLAGGSAQRLAKVLQATDGGKASLVFQGRTFLEHVVGAVATEVAELIVVAAPGQKLPALGGVRIVNDATPNAGPLAGIRDGLRAAWPVDRGDAPSPGLAFVASCDLPLLRREVVRSLLAVAGESDALWTVPVVHGHRQVLVSVMRFDLLPWIDAWLATGRRDLRGLLDEIAHTDPARIREVTEQELVAYDPALASFVDIDTPEDLARLQSR